VEPLLDSQVAQWFAATAATVSAGCGLLLVVHNAKNKGRKAAIDEADAMSVEVEALRATLLDNARTIFDLKARLAAAGLE
jgi:hypothetical protein